MGGMYSQFSTNKELETKGITLDYGLFRVQVARAGGSNKKFQRVYESETKPYRFMMQQGTLDDKKSEAVFHTIFAKACILGWETKTGEDEKGEPIFEQGIEASDGSLLEVTVDNITKTFRNLPDLFMDIKEQCMSPALFRQELLEKDVKN